MATDGAGALVSCQIGRMCKAEVSEWVQETVASMIAQSGHCGQVKHCADELQMLADRILQTSCVHGAKSRSAMMQLQSVKHFVFGVVIYCESLEAASQIWNITICSMSVDKMIPSRVQCMFDQLIDNAELKCTPWTLSKTLVAEPQLTRKHEFHAVLVGHSESRFQTDVLNLKEAVENCGYRVNAIPAATPEQVLSAIEQLSVEAKKGDVVVFYTSGHGGKDSGGNLNLFYGPNSVLAANVVCERLKLVKSEHMIVLIHCCFAGAFPNGLTVPTNSESTDNDDIAKVLSETSGKAVIFAGPPDKVTYGNIFPQAICNVFRSAKLHKKALRWSSLFAKASEHVEEHFKGKDLEQHMQITTNGAQDFYLWDPTKNTQGKEG